jgi:hypothetical protein
MALTSIVRRLAGLIVVMPGFGRGVCLLYGRGKTHQCRPGQDSSCELCGLRNDGTEGVRRRKGLWHNA